MRIFLNKLQWIALCLLLSSNIYAEETSPLSKGSLKQNTGSMNASLFTGNFQYTIPIYTIQDIDFELALSLRYNSDGFKPFQPSGCYGMGWTLKAGGCVTRLVQGVADEHKFYGYDKFGGIQDTTRGFLRAINEGNVPDKNDVFNFDESICDTCGIAFLPEEFVPCVQNKVDYMPDIFYFSFCGKSGSFIINNEGKIRIISGDFVKVDVSQLQDLDIRNMVNTYARVCEDSKITITTMDGYKYVFGGKGNALEYSVFCDKAASVDQNSPIVSAWHLTKIIAPNGRTMTFEYSSGIVMQSGRPNSLQSFYTDYDWTEQDMKDSTHIMYTLHRECLLNSITTSDSIPLTISFYSHPETFKMYQHEEFTYCQPHSQLDSIIVSYGEDTLREAHMKYQYKSYSADFYSPVDYKWRYLQQVYISGIGQYSMTYNTFDPYIDTVGSLIGGIQHIHWYPNLYVKNDMEYKNMVDRFGFWKVSPLQGMLKEISLPTGGKIKLTYGKHDYAEERSFHVVNKHDVELNSSIMETKQIGGARIEKIETYSDANTLVEEKTFSYTKQGTDNSSGIFYNLYEIFYTSGSDNKYPIVNPYNYGMLDSHIGYSCVSKNTTIGGQTYKTIYTYDTGLNHYTSLNNPLINRDINLSNYRDTVEVCSGSLTYDGLLRKKGKVLKKESYVGEMLRQSVHYKYNDISATKIGDVSIESNSLGCTDTIVCLSNNSALVARKLLVCPDVLEQITTYEYDNNGKALVSSKEYMYDKKLRKKEVRTTDSRGYKLFTRYTYPDELYAMGLLGINPIFFLVHSNRIGSPVETISGYIENETEYVTTGTINQYANNTFVVVGPDGQDYANLYYRPYLHKTLSLNIKQPINNYQPITISDSQVIYDPNYKLSCEYQYDFMYRLLSVKPFGKQETRYTWNNIYPITKTIGNQTWTYTYKPYVGLESITDPRGITTYYTYDKDGRLVETYILVNGIKQILNAYHYHIKTE